MAYSMRRVVLSLALCYLVLVFLFLGLFFFFSVLSALRLITSLGEERTYLSAFRTFVRFALVWFCLFTLPLGAWEGLRLVIVALPFLLPFFHQNICHDDISTKYENLGHVRSKTRSLGQISRQSFVHPRRHSFASIFMKLH